MHFKSLANKVIYFVSVAVIYLFFSLSFAYAEDIASPCEECKADYVPGETGRVEVVIITDKNCSFCDTQMPQNILKSKFPGIEFQTIDYREDQAESLIGQYSIQTLPCFLISPLIKEEKGFNKVKFIFEENATEKVLLKKELSGICLYLGRKEVKDKIDLFLDFYEEGASEILDDLISFSAENKVTLNLYFIVSQAKKVGYPKEEMRVALAVRELYPNEFNNYVYRRIKDIENNSWIDTVEKNGLSYKEIRELMISSVMDELVNNNKQLVEELMVGNGNVILVRNNKIFQVMNVDKKELKSFFEEVEE